MEDTRIVDKYLARDDSAIEATREKYGGRLMALALRIVDERTAEECVQDAYFKAWTSIPPNEPREYLFPYLARIVKNTALNSVRSESAAKRGAEVIALSREMEECLPGGFDAHSQAEQRELTAVINAFLGALDKRKRDVFVLRYWFLCSISEIAEKTGYSESKIKTMLFRMREKLKTQLQKAGYHV